MFVVLKRMIQGAMMSPLLFLVAAAALCAAASNLRGFARGADMIDLAASLERGANPEAGYVAKFVAEQRWDAVDENCADAGSRARLTIALAELREADLSKDVSLSPAALERALEASEARLKCSPTDGNAWLQWSRLELRAAGPTAKVVEGLTNSGLFAPSEFWVLGARLDAEAALERVGTPALDLQYSADLRQFIQFEATGAVAAAYVGHSDEVRSRMRPLIEALPDTQRKAIAVEVDRLGVDFARP